jgi:hypothetical protein
MDAAVLPEPTAIPTFSIWARSILAMLLVMMMAGFVRRRQ